MIIELFSNISLDTIILGVASIGLLICLIVWHKGSTKFDLQYLIVNQTTGQVELFKIGQFVSLLVSSWIIIHETRVGHLTDWLFTGYMIAWAGANLVNKAIESKKDTK